MMDINAPLVELLIISLIFGIRAVSALSECAVLSIAQSVQQDFPRLADLLRNARFVDDLADSDKCNDILEKIIDEADQLFLSVGLRCKGWSISGKPPHKDCTHDGISVDVGGLQWITEIDSISVKIPPLHFGKKVRGKLVVGTKIFDGTMESELDKFVPKELTRRQIVSKFASIYDPRGEFIPITAAMKVHLRKVVFETANNGVWDGIISDESRSTWVHNFWRLHQLRGVQFHRTRVPTDAANLNLELIAAADAANELKIFAVWGRFLRTNGKYSSQLIIGRSLLAKEDSTIPKNELEALTCGSNLLWIVRKALSGWCKDDYVLLSDSVISLCWVTSENKRLGLFHRNRTNQVRYNTDLEKLYFVSSEFNPADQGTRADKVSLNSVGPESSWENGLPWMDQSIEEAVKGDILKPVAELRMADNEFDEFVIY